MSPSPATPTPRPYPDYSQPPDLLCLPSTKTPGGRKPDDYQLRAQIKQMFQEGKLKAADKKVIKEFYEKYIVSEETITESSTSRYGRKRTRVLRKNYGPWHNLHIEM